MALRQTLQEKTDAGPAIGVRCQCSSATLHNCVNNLAEACSFSDQQKNSLLSLFETPRVGMKNSMCPEVSFTMWAFPPSEKAWRALEQLVLKTLRPRVFNFAETRAAQKEMFMVIPMKGLKVSTFAFEKWLDKFTENIGMSAGSICFADYFGDQMISSMLRIYKSRKVIANYPSGIHRDFSVLFVKLAAKYESEQSARAITGMDYTVHNFITLFREKDRQARKAQEAMQRERTWQDKRLELARIVHALGRTYAINDDTRKEMLQLIGPLSVPANASQEALNVTAAFSIMRRPVDPDARPLTPPTSIPQFPLTRTLTPDEMISEFQASWQAMVDEDEPRPSTEPEPTPTVAVM